MKIRLAASHDIQSIAKLHVDNWKNIYKGVLPSDYLNSLTYDVAEQDWIKYISQEDAYIYIATSKEDTVSGFAACKMDRETPGSGKLYSIHVNENYRGQGIGKQLISTVANHFLSRHINSMTLWVVETNEQAISIYKHLRAKPHKYETRYFDWVPVKQIGLIWNDVSCLCKKNG